MRILVVDTHAVLWWLEGNRKLPSVVRARMDDINTDLHLPALVIAELVDLCLKGRSGFDIQWLVRTLESHPRIVTHHFSSTMAINTAKYERLSDIHDRCIVATTTALTDAGYDAVLVTRDQEIADSGFVPTMWD